MLINKTIDRDTSGELKVTVKLFNTERPATDGSTIPRGVVDEYLMSEDYRTIIRDKLALGGLTHKDRKVAAQFEGVIGKDDMLLVSENCTHYISKIFFQDNDPFAWGILRVFNPKLFEGEQRKNIVNLRGLLASGCKFPVSVIIHGMWSRSNVCEKIVRVKGCDITANPAFIGAGVVKCMSDTSTLDHFESIRFREDKNFSNASNLNVPDDCIVETRTFSMDISDYIVDACNDEVEIKDEKNFSNANESSDSDERIFSRNEIILKYGLDSPEAKSTKHLSSVSESDLIDLADEWSSARSKRNTLEGDKSSGVVSVVKKSIEKVPNSNEYLISTKKATHKLPLEEGNRDTDKVIELMREIVDSEDPELIKNVFKANKQRFSQMITSVPSDDPNYKELMGNLLRQFFRNIPEVAHLSNINVVRDKSNILLDDTRFSAINRVVNSYKKYYELEKENITPDELLDLKKLLIKDIEVLFDRVKDKIREGANYNSLFGLTQFSQEISECGMELSKLRRRCLLALDSLGFTPGGIVRAYEDMAETFYNMLWKYVIGEIEETKEFGRVKQALIGGALGAGAGGFPVASSGGTAKQTLVGAGLGAIAGAGMGVINRKYQVVYLDKEGKVQGITGWGRSKESVCNQVKDYVFQSSRVAAFRYPEEKELINRYVQELTSLESQKYVTGDT